MMPRVLSLALLLLTAACGQARWSGQWHGREGAAGAKPQRVVSLNPCTDAILVEVAGPGQIAAISNLSQDASSTSIPLAVARRYATVGMAAEDVIAARPDLVIAGPHMARPTLDALARFGVPVLTVGVPQSIEESRAQVRAIARAVGREEQGLALERRVDTALAAARPRAGVRSIPALVWQGSGLVPGTGTLADDLLRTTGFRNISADLGLAQWDRLSLESLLLHPPAVLMTGRAGMATGEGESGRALGHPALDAAAAHMRIVDYPASLLHCGGPVIARAAHRLADIRRGMEEDRWP